MRRSIGTVLVAVFALAWLQATPAFAYAGFTITGIGHATIDGVASPGEWSRAGTTTFPVNLPDGSTTTATLYEMNDVRNMYVGLAFADASSYRDLSLVLEFDDDDQADWPEQGDDVVGFRYIYSYVPTPHFDQVFEDDFRHYAADLDQWWGVTDVGDAGSNDGAGMTGSDGATRFIEVSHPLDSGDVGHDFALSPGSKVGIHLSLRLFGGQYGTDTEFPLTEWYPYANWGFGEFTIAPAYGFQGFAAPVDNPPVVNAANAGRTIPLKWRVTDQAGAPVSDLTWVRVTAADLNCALGTTTDQVEEYATGATGLLSLGNGYYQFNWKTPKTYAGSCKAVHVDIGDAVVHSAYFSFSR